MTQVETPPPPATGPPLVVPDRRLLWQWVWSAVRPAVGWILALAGTITLVVGWYGVSGQALTAKQLPYLVSAGLAGMALFIMAGVFLATDDVRRQFHRLSALERKVDDLYALFVADGSAVPAAGAVSPSGAVPAAGAATVAAGALRVALPGGGSFHRPGCALVAGKPAAATVSEQEVDGRGLRPCRVCDPLGG